MEATFFMTPEGVLGTVPASPAELPAGALTFTTQAELADLVQHWPLRRLVELWNSLPGQRPVKRFEDRAIAVARLWRTLQPEAQSNAAGPSPTVGKRSRRRPAPTLPRANSKAARILALLARPEGATVKEIMAATGWQAHSVRGFVSGNLAKKRKLQIRSLVRDGQHAYRLPETSRGRA